MLRGSQRFQQAFRPRSVGAWITPLVMCMYTTVAAQDTVVVRVASAPQWGVEARLAEDLRIGMLDGPDEYIFGFIGSLAVRLDGSIYVYDYSVPIIRQYNSVGRHVRDIGRNGEGPG